MCFIPHDPSKKRLYKQVYLLLISTWFTSNNHVNNGVQVLEGIRELLQLPGGGDCRGASLLGYAE